ncbi:hypothetical protein JOD24_000303 [Kroppenstedtia sanguinis]
MIHHDNSPLNLFSGLFQYQEINGLAPASSVPREKNLNHLG